MSTVSSIGLKEPGWDFYKSKYDVIDELPLMSSPTPVLAILFSYLIFIFIAGPAYMEKRQPFKLKYTLLSYNFFQVILSAYMVYQYSIAVWKYGLFHKKCHLDYEDTRNYVIDMIYLYFVAKITELFDTVFFVLRKKNNQISFLHVYHHSIMMIGTWAFLKYGPGDTVTYIGLSNSFIHVIMYSYYGLSALGPNVAKYLWWKKYITSLQLIQFFTMLIYYVIANLISECPPAKNVRIFFIAVMLSFIALFANFYKNNYKPKKSMDKVQSNGFINGIAKEIRNEVKNSVADDASHSFTNINSKLNGKYVSNGHTEHLKYSKSKQL